MPVEHADIALPEFIDLRRICAHVVPLNRRTIERLVQAGQFPRPDLRLGRRMFWKASRVCDWLKSKSEVSE